MSKDQTFMAAQRLAFSTISTPGTSEHPNPFYVPASQITMPAFLIQEQPLSITTPQPVFVFGQKTADPTPILNNVIIGTNDVAIVYGIQLLIGYGATRNVRQYYSYGATLDDDVVYKSKLKMQFETNTLITDIETNLFRSEDGIKQTQYDGCILINPQRIFTGRNSIVNITLDMGDVSPLVFTPNAFISLRLLTGKGAAAATG